MIFKPILISIIYTGEQYMSATEEIKSKIRAIPNFPKPGIMFRDITTLLKDAKGFNQVIELLFEKYKNTKVDYVTGIESRGFILGAPLAHKLGVGFIPIRKKGKLPAKVIKEEYGLEYGKDIIELHADAIKKGDRILLIDDLLATAGTMQAAIRLVERLGGIVIKVVCLIELSSLKGRDKLKGYEVDCLIQYE